MIEGLKIKTLKIIPDERGRLMEILRKDDVFFEKFGQVYMTTAKPGVVKAWHYHKKQRDNFCCVMGKIRLGLYDARKDSSTFRETCDMILSLDGPKLVSIPPLVYHGFKGVASVESIVINVPTEMYNHKVPDEHRVDPYDSSIPFDWRR